MNKFSRALALMLCLTPVTMITQAQSHSIRTSFFKEEWSGWEALGQGVAVSYCEVDKKTWTWRFRNDGTTTITNMTFSYRDKDGTHPDLIPGSLKPREVFGGWASFTSSSKPTITLKTVTRK